MDNRKENMEISSNELCAEQNHQGEDVGIRWPRRTTVSLLQGKPVDLTIRNIPSPLPVSLRISFLNSGGPLDGEDMTLNFIEDDENRVAEIYPDGSAKWRIHPSNSTSTLPNSMRHLRVMDRLGVHVVHIATTDERGNTLQYSWKNTIVVKGRGSRNEHNERYAFAINIDWNEIQLNRLNSRRPMDISGPASSWRSRDTNETDGSQNRLSRKRTVQRPLNPSMKRRQLCKDDTEESPAMPTPVKEDSKEDTEEKQYFALHLYEAQTRALVPRDSQLEDGHEFILAIHNPVAQTFHTDVTVLNKEGQPVPMISRGTVELGPNAHAVLCGFRACREHSPLRLKTQMTSETGQVYAAKRCISVS